MTTNDTTDARALDAFLAEHLFGWKDCGPMVQGREALTVWRGTPPDAAIPGWRPEIPQFSTTGDGMLQVIEKMRERGFRLDLRDGGLEQVRVEWFHLKTPANGVALLPRDNTPLAVALAAKAALEAEGKR